MLKRTLALLCLAGPVAAETTLPPILITASRLAESTEETLYSTSVIAREAIEQMQAQDAADVLRRIPGIQIGRNGGPGQATSVFIRGAASDHTLVLIDGIPINSSTVGAAAFQHLAAEQIERIEVVRGPASTLYGSSAIGGVVQIFTRRAVPGTNVQIAAEAGGQGSRRASLNAGHGNALWQASATVSQRSTDGYPARPSLSSSDRGYRNRNASAALATALAGADVEFSHLQADGLVEYVNFFGSDADQDTDNRVTRLAIAFPDSGAWGNRLVLGRTMDRVSENQSDDFASTQRDYIDWQSNLALDDLHTLIGGVSGSWTESSLLSFGSGYDERFRSLEFYLQDTVEFGGTRIQFGGRAIDNNIYGRHFTWKAAAGHRFDQRTRIHANIGTAFRTPSANDLYGFGGNPTFEPETSLSGEIGLTHSPVSGMELRVVGFHTDIEDLIETDPVSFTVEQVEQARIQGIEFGYDQHLEDWQLSLDYTYQDPKNRDQNQPLPRRARHTLSAAARCTRPRGWGEATLRHESERRDSRFSDIVLEPYTTVDLALAFRIAPTLTISGRVQNLFDEEYELAATYPAQDRLVSIELRYDYSSD
jgi:vitamin B12 transporter